MILGIWEALLRIWEVLLTLWEVLLASWQAILGTVATLLAPSQPARSLSTARYEGRSWLGFHHHLALAAVAYLFVMVVYLGSKKNFWCYVGNGFARDAAVVGACDRLLSVLRNRIPAANP